MRKFFSSYIPPERFEISFKEAQFFCKKISATSYRTFFCKNKMLPGTIRMKKNLK